MRLGGVGDESPPRGLLEAEHAGHSTFGGPQVYERRAVRAYGHIGDRRAQMLPKLRVTNIAGKRFETGRAC